MIDKTNLHSVVVIPAFQPNQDLTDLVRELVNLQMFSVIVVNDGSKEVSVKVFAELEDLAAVTVIHHKRNLGKGQALRTAIDYFLANFSENNMGIITSDADGQHTVSDIVKISQEQKKFPKTLILGARIFSRAVPIRSYIGNQLTRYIFKFFVGKMLVDTQTGLRAIPVTFLPELLKINLNGYEFELEVLIRAVENKIPIHEVPIDTIYKDGNKTSHFNPLVDSFKIYFLFFRFLVNSLLSALVDFAVFAICFLKTENIFFSLFFARLVAGSFNFTMGRSFVFKSAEKTLPQILKYVALVLLLLMTSYVSMIFLVNVLNLNIFISKVVSEGTLFLLSFTLQNLLIFRSRDFSKNH